jgi:MYXO-CTERM domain-containing protein
MKTTDSLKTALKLGTVLGGLLLASTALAIPAPPDEALVAPEEPTSECQADADCGEGKTCQLYSTGGGTCSVDEMGNEVCTEEAGETVGVCVEAPIACSSDADCGPGLGCILAEATPLPAPDCEPGQDCGDGDRDPAENNSSGLVAPSGFCGWTYQQCEADADCGEFGQCVVTGGTGCAEAAPACPPGEECEPVEPGGCEDFVPEEFSQCVPREIECDTDAACPADWTCQEYIYGVCGGSEGGGSMGSDERPAPPCPEGEECEDGSEGFAPPPPDCTEEVRRLCTPPGGGYIGPVGVPGDGPTTGIPEDQPTPDAPGDDRDPNGGDEDLAGGDGGGSNEEDDEDGSPTFGEDGDGEGSADEEDAGSCSVTGNGGKASGAGGLGALLLGLVGLISRRRR